MKPANEPHPSVYRQRRIDLPRMVFYLICGLIFAFLIAPMFIVIPISFSSARYLQFPPVGFSLQWYERFFGSGEWIRGTLNSFRIAVMASMLSSLLGIPAALALTRYRFKGSQILQSLMIAPMITPVIITAIAVYFFLCQTTLDRRHFSSGDLPFDSGNTDCPGNRVCIASGFRPLP